MSSDLKIIIIIGILFAAVFAVFIDMFIFTLYYSVLKRAKIYCQIRKEIKRVRKQHNTPLVSLYGGQPSLNQTTGKQVWEEARQEFYKDGDDEKF
ncbi:hypothetical protein [Bartonella vinsonii]|uniref:hypothetical protein n=1 Tax=Bartonella vinsonii TaxID=33047 RepID=UPI00034742FE|nr:hypothetical protein [Bartonella vinsonii]